MSDNNVIPFGPALLRQRERQAARSSRFADVDYSGGGIDELWAGPFARGAGGMVIRLY